MSTPILPHQFIVNRGYISASQNILTDIINVGNYIGAFPTKPNLGCAPASSIDLTQGTYQWGVASDNNKPVINYRKPIDKTCINLPKVTNGFNNSSILDYTYFNLVLDQNNIPTGSNIWEKNLSSINSGNIYAKSTTPFINILKDGNPTRISYMNTKQSNAIPETIRNTSDGFYYITYNTEVPFSVFNTDNHSTPTPLQSPVNNKISPDQWDITNGNTNGILNPPWWTIIKNEWNILTRNHVDQILIMDSVNNIYLNSIASITETSATISNLIYGVTPIYYSAYAAKVLPTMEPFKSLLAGTPIDIIQANLNVFNMGIISSNTNPVITRSSIASTPSASSILSSGTISPYTQSISIPAVTIESNVTKNMIPKPGVVCDRDSGMNIVTVQECIPLLNEMKPKVILVPSHTPICSTDCSGTVTCEPSKDCVNAPMLYQCPSATAGTDTANNCNTAKQTITIVPAYNGIAPKKIFVPLYKLIKVLWEKCSGQNPIFVVVDNNENNIESSIPDFAYLTDSLKTIYRCYFWALNCNNKSINGSRGLQANAYTSFVTEPYTSLNLPTTSPDLSYLIDAGAYYKAIYDNCYQYTSEWSDMFGKPSEKNCATGCGAYTDRRTGAQCTPTQANYNTCVASPACKPMCNNNFCVNSYPNYTSGIYNTLSKAASSYVFCGSNGNASSNLMTYPTSFYPQVQAPPPPPPVMPPSIPLPPRLGATTTATSIAIQDKQTFLCQDRGLGHIYRYNATNNTKTQYSSAGIAATYTPSMDLSSSMWVWSNSLDGTSLKCNNIPSDLSNTISCPSGQTCITPSSSISLGDLNTGYTEPENEEPRDEEPGDEEPADDNVVSEDLSEGITMLSIIIGIIGYIFFIIIAGLIIYFAYVNRKKIPKPKLPKLSKVVKPNGGYFYYD